MDTEERYTPIGKVSIIDAETGESIVDTHNMIVKTGRQLIAKAVFGGADTEPGISFDKFKFFYEQNLAGELTTATMTYDKIKDNIVKPCAPHGVMYEHDKSFTELSDKGFDINASADELAAAPDSIEINGIEYERDVNSTSGTNRYYHDEYVFSYAMANGDVQVKLITAPINPKTNSDKFLDIAGDNAQVNIGHIIKFDVADDDAYKPITAIGLIYGDDTLFSRAVFDPVYMRKNRMYIIKYTIYF